MGYIDREGGSIGMCIWYFFSFFGTGRGGGGGGGGYVYVYGVGERHEEGGGGGISTAYESNMLYPVILRFVRVIQEGLVSNCAKQYMINMKMQLEKIKGNCFKP